MKIINWAYNTRVDFLFCVLGFCLQAAPQCALYPVICAPLSERKEGAQRPTKLLRAEEKLAV